MSDSNDFGVPQVTKKRAFIGKKVTYVFRSLVYDTFEQAEIARNKEIEQLRIEATERDHLNQLYAAYDEHPEYVTSWVISPPISDTKDVWFGMLGQRDTGLAAFVDVPKLSEAINQQLRDLAIRGYEVVSVNPINSGVAGYNIPGGRVNGGAGWGYSFTQGVIITAQLRSNLRSNRS